VQDNTEAPRQDPIREYDQTYQRYLDAGHEAYAWPRVVRDLRDLAAAGLEVATRPEKFQELGYADRADVLDRHLRTIITVAERTFREGVRPRRRRRR
jgi:hypothetical protein